MGTEKLPKTIWWETDEETGKPCVLLVDQAHLPVSFDVLKCTTHAEVCTAIRTMALRGAPALGVGAAFALALWSANESEHTDVDSYLDALDAVAAEVSSVRPTAVNLAWGAEQVTSFAHAHSKAALSEIKHGVIEFACHLRDDDEERCRAIGANGAALFEDFRIRVAADGTITGGACIMTHCNAGSLATARYGTATGVIYAAFEQQRVSQVWVRETRPVNQGARLTAWEMMRAGLPCALVCDSAAASLMAAGLVDGVVVGADRICANGDVANKIGTYDLACLAMMHRIPFYVAAPNSTIDLACATGADVDIEQRPAREVEGFYAAGRFTPAEGDQRRAFELLCADGPCTLDSSQGHEMRITADGDDEAIDVWMRTTPAGIPIANPAFDITPAALITAIITEKGVYAPADIAQSMQG